MSGVTDKEIILKAIADEKYIFNVADEDAARQVCGRLRKNRLIGADWRIYQRKKLDDTVDIYVFSPLCSDPEPPTFKKPIVVARKTPKRENNGLHVYVLEYLCDQSKHYKAVVPMEDVKRLKSVSNYETYISQKVRERMSRNDVRVMLKFLKSDGAGAVDCYIAETIFLGRH